MCGIVGLVARPGHTVSATILQQAAQAIRHRGPDDEGYALVDSRRDTVAFRGGPDTVADLDLPPVSAPMEGQPDIGFGFRRLAILDLSSEGHQPMLSRDGKALMVFNGEVYNFKEIAAELRGLGHTFRSSGDTEVILAAYRQWGLDCFARFRGMWAIAILDRAAQRIVFSRDPFGIKFLYYAIVEDGLVFGSEIKAVLAHPQVAPRIRPQGLYNYIHRGRPGIDGGSMIEGIYQIPPATLAVVPLSDVVGLAAGGRIETAPYTQITVQEPRRLPFRKAVTEVREAFLESVRLHLRADVPVAVNLSGGIDSSAVLCAARKVLGRSAELRTFSFIANESFLSEEKWIDMVVAATGATPTKVVPQPSDLRADIEALLAAQDEPIGSISPYAQNRVFRLASEAGIIVTLDGQGADEYLAGYRSYLRPAVAECLAKGEYLRGARIAVACQDDIAGGLDAIMRQSEALFRQASDPPAAAAGRRLPMALGMTRSWFEDRACTPLPTFSPQGTEYLRESLHNTLTASSLPELLRFADRNSMAYSIESRVPFLESDLVNTVLSLPSRFLIDERAQTKAVFRAAMRGIVPDAILDRRDKIGFTVPEKHWLADLQDWGADLLDDLRTVPFADAAKVRAEWDAQREDRAPYTGFPWRWVNLALWMRFTGATVD